MRYKGLNNMKKRFLAALLCLCLLVGLVPAMGTTAFAASTTDYAIGDTVEFGGYSWRIIGTETKGVTAPEGCYTLLIADDVFGSTAFREGADGENEEDNHYSGSDLQKAMEEIAADFSFVERQNIVPRDLTAANDEIAGPDVTDQYVWALSQTEAENVYNNSVWYSWYYIYWTRTDVEERPGSHYVYPNRTYTGGDSIIPTGDPPSESRYIFPALYVKASALPAPPPPPATGDFVLGQDAISSAAVGGRLVANSGSDVGLTISQNQTVDVRVYKSEANQSGSSLSFCLDHQSTTTGENQVLACVLTDGVPMLWVADGTYTLSIFSHNIQTNEISQPSPTMTVTVDGGVGTVSNYKGQYKDIVIVFPDPVFTKQPQSQYVTPDSSVTFTVEAAQNGIPIEESSNYAWYAQDKSDPDGPWYRIYGGLPGTVALPIMGKELIISNVSGTWNDNNKMLNGAGADVTFQPKDARFRCVVTGNYSGSATSNAAELWVIEGTDGEDGREVELRTNDTHIQWRYEDETEWKDLVALSDIAGSDGADGKQVELRVEDGYIQWKYDADSDWQNLIALSALQGIKGDKGDKGDPGEDGDTPYIGDNGNWWIGTTDTGINASGTDGSNGSNGSDGEDGQDGKDGTDGLTPYVGSNGNWWIGTTDTGIKAASTNGANGQNGTNGKNGADGVGIADIKLNENGELIITLTDGTENNLGKVKGEDGVGISGVSINENGELIVTLTNGTELNAGIVRTAETAAAMGSTEISHLKTLVYVSVGIASVSLAGLIGLLAFLLTRRKSLIGK